MTSYKVLVTGATGLVGLNAVKTLLASGHQVIALVRKTSNTAELLQLPEAAKLSIAYGELTDTQANIAELQKTMQGVDVVVHAAGTVDVLGKREAIRAVNVGGTNAVLSAARKASVKQFIQISSLSVITGQGDQFNVNESAPLRYCGEAYADSKVDAEKLVMSEATSQAIKVTALRPGFIYGPGERAWLPRLINSLTERKAMLIDGGKRQTNVIYVGNLSQAILGAIMNPKAFGQVYNLTDGEFVSKKQLFDTICDGLSLPHITRQVPRAIAWAACEVISTIAPNLKPETQRKLGRFSRAAFRLAGVNQGFDVSKAEQDLGYTNRISFADGMQETLKSFKEARIVDPSDRSNSSMAMSK